MDRWHASIRIQRYWRGKLCRLRVKKLKEQRMNHLVSLWNACDREEAALVIQTQIRKVLARVRARRVMEERAAAAAGLSDGAMKNHRELFNISAIPQQYFVLSTPPTENELRALFSQIDPNDLGYIDRRHCYDLYESFVGPSSFGINPTLSDDQALRETVDKLLVAVEQQLRLAAGGRTFLGRGQRKRRDSQQESVGDDSAVADVNSHTTVPTANEPAIDGGAVAASGEGNFRIGAPSSGVVDPAQQIEFDAFCFYILKLLAL